MQAIQQLYYIFISLLFGSFLHIIYFILVFNIKKHLVLFQIVFYTIAAIFFIRIIENNEVPYNNLLLLFIVLGYYLSAIFMSKKLNQYCLIGYLAFFSINHKYIKPIIKLLFYPPVLRVLYIKIRMFLKKLKTKLRNLLKEYKIKKEEKKKQKLAESEEESKKEEDN